MPKTEKIHIPEPCNANWQQMKPCSNGRFCGSCQKAVVDFTDKTLDEIQSYLTEHSTEHICGRYQERHTKDSLRYRVIDSIENAFIRIKMRRVALLLVPVLLFIVGCKSRKLQGYVGFTDARFLTQDSTIVSDPAKKKKYMAQDTTSILDSTKAKKY